MKKIFVMLLSMLSIVAFAEKQSPPYDLVNEHKDYRLENMIDVPFAMTMAFDKNNIPYIYDLANDYISTLEDGKWVQIDFKSALDNAKLSYVQNVTGMIKCSLTIDDSGDLYLILNRPFNNEAGDKIPAVLLYSKDKGKSFQVLTIDFPAGSITMESHAGGNSLANPPAILTAQQTKTLPGTGQYRWAKYHTMYVLLPKKVDGKLELGEPILLTDKGLGLTLHSGGYHNPSSFGDLVHVAYMHIPEDVKTGGNPTRIVTIDRNTNKIIKDVYLVNADPKMTDVHSNPEVIMNYRQELQLMTGAHYRGRFIHKAALEANSIDSWSDSIYTGGIEQSYVSMVCGQDNTIYLASRDFHRLVFRYKKDGEAWSKPIRFAYTSARNGDEYYYANYYHHLFIDRNDNLYITFTLNDQQKNRLPKITAMSKDKGITWELANTEYMLSQINK